MKRKITLLFVAASAALTMNSQVMLQENFTAPFAFNAAGGWTVQNNSVPVGTVAITGSSQQWFSPGNVGTSSGAYIPNSYNGANGDFVSTGFVSTDSQGGISNWLISPTVTIQNGAIFKFATRTVNATTIFPDRLELRMSTTPANSIPTGSASVGSFNNLLFSVNPNLSTSTSSAIVSVTTTAGYPVIWTVYSVQVTGVPSPVVGNFAFRYFVENGGGSTASTNSFWIGIDAVSYIGACPTPVITSYTTCQNMAVTLNATGGGLPTTAYSWTNTTTNATYTGASINVTSNPTMGSTDTYSVEVFNGATSCGIYTTAAITTSNTVSMNVVATATNVCAGNNTTLTVVTAANNYTWSTGAQTPSITVPATTNTVYSISYSSGGFPPTCTGNANISINVSPLPIISQTVIGATCSGNSFSLTASGNAILYLWDSPSFVESTDNPLVLIGGATPGVRSFTLYGIDANGCIASVPGGYTILGSPTITIIPPPTSGTVNVCQKSVGVMEAAGANTYTWTSGGSTLAIVSAANATTNPISFNTGSISALSPGAAVTFTVKGKDANGCVGSTTQSVKVNVCAGIENLDGSVVETSVYPNPFTNELKIEALIGHVEIYNALGQVVISVAVKENGIIDASDLAKGVYILKAYNAQGDVVKTSKLMKN